MIPKVIHFVWVGGNPKSRLALKCIDSWKRTLPDFQIKEWNENNFDISKYPYAAEAHRARKWAYVADVIRLHALFTEGGIYMDSDVEVLRRFDEFMDLPAFTGYESPSGCITGIMASERGGQWVKDLLEAYKNRRFLLSDGSLNLTTNVQYTNELMISKGAVIDGSEIYIPGYVRIFPNEYFCPKKWDSNEVTITPQTYTIHHFAGSWLPPRVKREFWLRKHIGEKTAFYYACFADAPWKTARALLCAFARRVKRLFTKNPTR